MSNTNLQHGATRNRTITTGDGSSHVHPEIYCVEHGWMQLFLVGGKDGFNKKHWFCNQRPKNGAGAEIEETVKVLAKAA